MPQAGIKAALTGPHGLSSPGHPLSSIRQPWMEVEASLRTPAWPQHAHGPCQPSVAHLGLPAALRAGPHPPPGSLSLSPSFSLQPRVPLGQGLLGYGQTECSAVFLRFDATIIFPSRIGLYQCSLPVPVWGWLSGHHLGPTSPIVPPPLPSPLARVAPRERMANKANIAPPQTTALTSLNSRVLRSQPSPSICRAGDKRPDGSLCTRSVNIRRL